MLSARINQDELLVKNPKWGKSGNMFKTTEHNNSTKTLYSLDFSLNNEITFQEI